MKLFCILNLAGDCLVFTPTSNISLSADADAAYRILLGRILLGLVIASAFLPILQLIRAIQQLLDSNSSNPTGASDAIH
jgi:hypothetical protein